MRALLNVFKNAKIGPQHFFFCSYVVPLILVLQGWEWLDMVKDPLNLKKAKIGPKNVFLQPPGALNFGLTSLGVTGHVKEPL